MKKIFLSIILSLALCLSLLPTAAFAAEPPYTITYEANDGTGNTYADTATSGTYTLQRETETGFTAPEGKQFKGWEVNGIIYAANSPINITSDTTVKAIWVIPTSIQIQSKDLYASTAVAYQLDEKITRYWKNGDTESFTGTADDYNAKIEWSTREGKDVATITLKGANTVDSDNTNNGLTIVAANTFDVDIVVEEDSTMEQITIYSCDVSISGGGKLTVVDPKRDAQNIYVDGNLTIKNGANIYAESLEKNAANVIFAKNDLIIDNSTVEIKSGSDWTETAYPDWNFAPLRSNGTMTILNDSDVSVTCTDGATCHAVMSLEDITIEDSAVTITNNGTNRGITTEKDLYIQETASGTTNVTVNSNGIAIAARSGKLSISGGTVTATPTTTYAALRADEIEVSGGKVTANAVRTYGMYAEVSDITISGDADVDASSETSIAMYAKGTVDISGDADVDASSETERAIYATGAINISENANVKASGQWALQSNANNIAISGGTVEAISTNYALVSKPVLSNYANPIVFAGADANTASIVADTAGTDYHNLNKYVRIQPSSYIITFNANGGTVTPTSAPTDASYKLTSLPTPTYTGYKFNGWFTAATGGTEITTETVFDKNSTIYAQWTKTYTVTFDSNGGTGSMVGATVDAGSSYTLPDNGFTAPANQQFKAWKISDTEYAAGDTYTVNADTSIVAVWEDITVIPTTYTVTVNGSYANSTGAGSYAEGASVTISAGSRSNYRFTGWTVSGVTLSSPSSATTTFTMPANAVTVTANWSYNGSSGGGYKPPVTSVTVPISGDDNTINVDASVSGSKATVDDVDLSKLDTVIGEDVNTGVVTIDFSGLNKSIDTVEIPSDVVKQIAEAVNNPANDAESLEIVLSDGTSIEFDAAALGEKSAQANGLDITISIKSSRGNGAQQSVVGNRTAYDINVTSGGKAISDMGGMVTVHAPYELKSGEIPRGVVVYYIDENGNEETCETSYDSVKKRVNWKTDHLSLYMIGYDEELAESCPKDETCPMYPFTDVDVNAWYHDGVHYAIENGLMKGTSTTEKLFSPNGTTTRAQIVTILWRMENEPAVNYDMSFEDVADGKWYTEAVRWAAANEIVFGYNGKFNPNDPITREQFAAILWRYAKYKGYDVSVGENTNILSYEDALTVSEYAVPAMQWVCGTGIIQGISSANGGMLLDPQGNAIRSQAATIIMRFDENVKK